MSGTISSRTPEGAPNDCPICGNSVHIEPSQPSGDAPCPSCGSLLWFCNTSVGIRFYDSKAVAPIRDRILRSLGKALGVGEVTPSFLDDFETDSLDTAELVMELEEEFGVSIPDDEAQAIRTVGDAIDYLAKRN